VSGFVIDASVAVKWVVTEADSGRAMAIRRHRLAAPDLLVPECANVLWKKVRRGEMSAEAAALAASLVERADVELVPMRTYLAAALIWAMKLNHPVYDCIYLALAVERGLPFVSADAAFRRKLDAEQGRCGAIAISLEQAAGGKVGD
jgi:predicted nucleic acid-binding protein